MAPVAIFKAALVVPLPDAVVVALNADYLPKNCKPYVTCCRCGTTAANVPTTAVPTTCEASTGGTDTGVAVSLVSALVPSNTSVVTLNTIRKNVIDRK